MRTSPAGFPGILLLSLVLCGCPQDVPETTTTQTAPPPVAASREPIEVVVQPESDSPAPEPREIVHPLSKEQQADGWLSLFDGHSLFGWVPDVEGVNWSVESGVIQADDGPIGLIVTTVPFANYELLCDFRMAEGGNSGVFLRTIPDPQDVTRDCYEVNISDSHPQGYTTGSIVGRQATPEPIPGSGDWKTFRIVADQNRITVDLNGEQVMDFTDESDHPIRFGQIGLQKNRGKIEFRNVFLKPLGMTPLFNGEDLSGWRVVPGSQAQFEATDGVIHATGGPGFLETEQTFENFLFQTQAITHAADLNSGFFYRAQPGTEQAPSNGYEVQIHNGFDDGDRTRPNNAGTGAIFRRVDARRVIPDDLNWFMLTLAAHGPRFAVWVDGYQVVDWVDERPAHDNPRQGLRLDGGHISLQGHDPGTNVSFRNLSISELDSAAP